MSHMQFDSLDEAFEWMQKRTEEANANLHDKQRGVTWGDHWCRFVDVANRLVVFGKVDTIAEVEAGERGEYDTPISEESQAELDYTLEHLRHTHERGYLYGRSFCTHYPEGELGDTHRANLWPIEKSLYDAAEQAGWVIDDLPNWAKHDLQHAWTGYRNHMMHLVLGDNT